MTEFSRQALVADIGHTSIRFALADIDQLTIRDFASMETAMFTGPAEALAAYLRTVPERPSMVSVAIAGAVKDGRAGLSRRDWSFAARDIQRVLDAEVCLINDLESVALLLPHLVAHDVRAIGGTAKEAKAPQLVLGLGTTMALAARIPAEAGPVAISGPVDAMAFAAQGDAELALIRAVPRRLPYVSVGDVLSASGLVGLERALSKGPRAAHFNAADVVRAALVHRDPLARQALEQLANWLGGFAGDMTLAYGARGGVFVAGGMARALLPMLEAGAFRAAFEARGARSDALADVPIHIITAPDVCLRGAALAASRAAATGGFLASAA